MKFHRDTFGKLEKSNEVYGSNGELLARVASLTKRTGLKIMH